MLLYLYLYYSCRNVPGYFPNCSSFLPLLVFYRASLNPLFSAHRIRINNLSSLIFLVSLLLLAFWSKVAPSSSRSVVRNPDACHYEKHFAFVIAPATATIGHSLNLMFSTIRLPLLSGIERPLHMPPSSEGYMFQLSPGRHPNARPSIYQTVTQWIHRTRFQNNSFLGSA